MSRSILSSLCGLYICEHFTLLLVLHGLVALSSVCLRRSRPAAQSWSGGGRVRPTDWCSGLTATGTHRGHMTHTHKHKHDRMHAHTHTLKVYAPPSSPPSQPPLSFFPSSVPLGGLTGQWSSRSPPGWQRWSRLVRGWSHNRGGWGRRERGRRGRGTGAL